MGINFFKLHGLGNDYIVIDERKKQVIVEESKKDFAQKVCRRGFSAGADGVLYLKKHENEDLQMRIFNADGSEAESCGNGLRCAAYYHHGINREGESKFRINLPLAAPVEAEVSVKEPPLGQVTLKLGETEKYYGKMKLEINGKLLHYHSVDVGNPHAVFFLGENEFLPQTLEEIELDSLGPKLQNHPRFEETDGINAEFVVTDRRGNAEMRVHERGVGETTSCGTGSMAVARSIIETERAKGWVEVSQPGGMLVIHPRENKLSGPAEFSYEGKFPDNFRIESTSQ